MKVAILSFIFEQDVGGGAVASALRLAQGLARRQNDVVVITTHRQRQSSVSVEDRVKVYRLHPHNLYWVGDKGQHGGLRKVLWQLVDAWNPQIYARVRQILQLEKPDVVHVHKLRGLSPSVWSAAHAAGCHPIIQTCRDYELLSPEGTLMSRVGRWAEQGVWFMRPYSWSRARNSRLVDVAIAPSRYTLETLSDRGFFPHAEQLVIPNTHGFRLAELEQVKAEASQVTHERPPGIRLLYLGRLEQTKGIDLVCDALIGSAEDHPTLFLDVVGGGTFEQQLRQSYAAHPQIYFHGPLHGAAKAQLLHECDVVVVPSIWPEVFGNVIIESYVYGKPVIATRVGGIPENIEEGVTGMLVVPADRVALQAAISQAAAQPETIWQMQEACFDAARRYALETITDSYLRAYQSG